MIFRILSKEEEKEFRKATRDTYIHGKEINNLFHPVCQEESHLMNIEYLRETYYNLNVEEEENHE